MFIVFVALNFLNCEDVCYPKAFAAFHCDNIYRIWNI